MYTHVDLRRCPPYFTWSCSAHSFHAVLHLTSKATLQPRRRTVRTLRRTQEDFIICRRSYLQDLAQVGGSSRQTKEFFIRRALPGPAKRSSSKSAACFVQLGKSSSSAQLFVYRMLPKPVAGAVVALYPNPAHHDKNHARNDDAVLLNLLRRSSSPRFLRQKARAQSSSPPDTLPTHHDINYIRSVRSSRQLQKAFFIFRILPK